MSILDERLDISSLRKPKAKTSSAIDALAAGDRKAAVSVLIGREKDQTPKDWRVRLSVAPKADYLYKDPNNKLLAPLAETNGVIFPYTPRITMAYNATYDKVHPTHSNYPIHTYTNSGVATISISGGFTAQTPYEARYLLAVMTFFRSATKMFWGKDEQAGMPPPVLYLNGYGTHFLPNVPVVITSYNNDLADDVDYVEAFIEQPTRNGPARVKTRVPAAINVSVTCEPVYSREKIHNEFTFEKFARGDLIGGNGLGRGGFI